MKEIIPNKQITIGEWWMNPWICQQTTEFLRMTFQSQHGHRWPPGTRATQGKPTISPAVGRTELRLVGLGMRDALNSPTIRAVASKTLLKEMMPDGLHIMFIPRCSWLRSKVCWHVMVNRLFLLCLGSSWEISNNPKSRDLQKISILTISNVLPFLGSTPRCKWYHTATKLHLCLPTGWQLRRSTSKRDVARWWVEVTESEA